MVRYSVALACTLAVCAQGWKPLFDGKTLQGWESLGDGQWTVLADGTLVGQRVWDRKMLAPGGKFTTPREYQSWLDRQAWLYTTAEYGNFDLHVEFWTKTTGNSGISLRDPSRGKFGIAEPPDFSKRPRSSATRSRSTTGIPTPRPPAAFTPSTKRRRNR